MTPCVRRPRRLPLDAASARRCSRRLPDGGRRGARQPRPAARAPGALRGARLLRRAAAASTRWRVSRCAPPSAATRATGSTPTVSRSSQALAGQDPRAPPREARGAQPARAAGRAAARCAESQAARAPQDPAAIPSHAESRAGGARAPQCGYPGALASRARRRSTRPRAQQRDAAEQDRDRGEAGERELAAAAPAGARLLDLLARAAAPCRCRRPGCRGSSPRRS